VAPTFAATFTTLFTKTRPNADASLTTHGGRPLTLPSTCNPLSGGERCSYFHLIPKGRYGSLR
jgi:hypothetical protein